MIQEEVREEEQDIPGGLDQMEPSQEEDHMDRSMEVGAFMYMLPAAIRIWHTPDSNKLA